MTRAVTRIVGDEEGLRALFREVPVIATLGMELASLSNEGATVTMPFSRAHVQEEGILHGGILTTLADTAAVYSLAIGLPEGQSMTSIELKLNFLRPAVPDLGALEARSKRIRRSRKVGVSEVEVFQADRLLAKGLFTYLFFTRRLRPRDA